MIGRLVAVLALAGLAACSPEPRSASYFEAHPDEAAKVADACKAGTHRGQECVNAEAGVAAAQRTERMNAFRKGFSKD
ncbi:EexN family lipoprotein [Phenylobacterium sp.]|uniref:EexN family lipoprotein n=1 Tax=Phenylobacterium sp. TaxID=1871053 RepID=UPI00289656ED|nr:EexN family lipoprotein [Phenylobacterium sp.]